jgi:hypothetical protein
MATSVGVRVRRDITSTRHWVTALVNSNQTDLPNIFKFEMVFCIRTVCKWTKVRGFQTTNIVARIRRIAKIVHTHAVHEQFLLI